MKNVFHTFGRSAPGDKTKLVGSWFNLSRDRDGEGNAGQLLIPYDRIKQQADGQIGEIIVGKSIMVQERTTGGYWFVTTEVTQIKEISEDGRKVLFKTRNSDYTVVSSR